MANLNYTSVLKGLVRVELVANRDFLIYQFVQLGGSSGQLFSPYPFDDPSSFHTQDTYDSCPDSQSFHCALHGNRRSKLQALTIRTQKDKLEHFYIKSIAQIKKDFFFVSFSCLISNSVK